MILLTITIKYLLNGSNNIVFTILNTVCALAICLLTSGLIFVTATPNKPKNGKNIIVPTILNIKCIAAALCAVLLAPILAIIAVIHVPILHPNIIGKATCMLIAPAVANATNIPVVADELCNIAVIVAPAITPISQLSPIVTINCSNTGELVRGFIAPLIIPIPVNKIPKPNTILPMSFLFLPLANITIIVPKNTNNGAI